MNLTVHCPRCDQSEFSMEMEADAVGYALIEAFVLNGTKIERPALRKYPHSERVKIDDVENDRWRATNIIHCNHCQHTTLEGGLIVKENGEPVPVPPSPGPGQMQLKEDK